MATKDLHRFYECATKAGAHFIRLRAGTNGPPQRKGWRRGGKETEYQTGKAARALQWLDDGENVGIVMGQRMAAVDADTPGAAEQVMQGRQDNR